RGAFSPEARHLRTCFHIDGREAASRRRSANGIGTNRSESYSVQPRRRKSCLGQAYGGGFCRSLRRFRFVAAGSKQSSTATLDHTTDQSMAAGSNGERLPGSQYQPAPVLQDNRE